MQSQETLLSQARQGRPEAFEALVAPHVPRLYRLALLLLADADDAEDATQEALIAAYRSIHTFRGDASISTWLHRIAINTARNRARLRARQSPDRLQALALHNSNTAPRIETIVLERERASAIRQAVRDLPEHYRDAIILIAYQELTYEDAAAVLAVPVGTVKSRVSQAKVLLSRRLRALGVLTE